MAPRKNEIDASLVHPGSNVRRWWICSKGHEWQARPADRIAKGNNCPECAASIFVSKAEKEVAEYVRSLRLNTLTSVRTVIRGELDIYVPKNNIAIEFNGLYWHSEFFTDSDYHNAKYQKCKDKGIQLIQVWEDDWKFKPDLVKRMLAYKLGVSSERRVFARNTIARLLSQDEANSFLDEYHIQGAVDGGIRVGLFENINDVTGLCFM